MPSGVRHILAIHRACESYSTAFCLHFYSAYFIQHFVQTFSRIKCLSQQINCQEAILHVSNGNTEREYCIVHNHSWTPLSQSLEAAVSFIFTHFKRLSLTSQAFKFLLSV